MAFDKTKPAGTIPLKTLDDQCRTNFEALEDAIGQDHDFATGSTQTGKHDKVTLKAPLGSKPSLSASEGALYSKDVSAKAELFYEDEDGDEVQLTSGGLVKAVNVATAAVLRIINVKLMYKDSSHTNITITSLWNGDTLAEKELSDTVGYYDFNVTGNCLGVIGCFQSSSHQGGAGEIYPNVRPWAAAVSNNLRLSITPSTAYGEFGKIITASNQYVNFTVAYLTDA